MPCCLLPLPSIIFPKGLAIGVAVGGSSYLRYHGGCFGLGSGGGIRNLLPKAPLFHSLYGATVFPPSDHFFRSNIFFHGNHFRSIGGRFSQYPVARFFPYALAFAAGAMIYVVFAEINPEAHSGGNKKNRGSLINAGICRHDVFSIYGSVELFFPGFDKGC